MKNLIFIILFSFPFITWAQQQLIGLCSGESTTVTYMVDFGGDGTNVWNVNGETYTTDELTYTFTTPGSYTITVRRDNVLCYVEQSIEVIVTDCLIYWVPNSFTPDDNEHNQMFGPMMVAGFDFGGFSFCVYNRWGEKVWESNDPKGRWDGYYNGVLCPDGVYIWTLQFNTFGDDGKIKTTGFVTILK